VFWVTRIGASLICGVMPPKTHATRPVAVIRLISAVTSTRGFLAGIFLALRASALFAQGALFPFVGINAAISQRAFSDQEALLVTVASMQPGEELRLSRCGNERCSVSSPVATWTFEDFGHKGAVVVRTERDRYGFYLYNHANGDKHISGVYAATDGATTILRFESGTSVKVVVQRAP
jgi:hypothetical protein